MDAKKPQLENGYTRIANEILEAMAETNFTAYQSRFIHALWRKLYGYGKKEDWISNSQLIELTNLKKGHLSRTKKELVGRKVIVTSLGNKIQFNKDYSQWCELPSQVTVTSLGTGVTKRGTKVTSLGGHKRNYTKETYTKESVAPRKKMEEFIESVQTRNEGFVKMVEKITESKQIPRERAAAELLEFVRYWTEASQDGKRIRWREEKFFDLSRRLGTWFKRATTSKFSAPMPRGIKI